jgi:hypothetical protein
VPSPLKHRKNPRGKYSVFFKLIRSFVLNSSRRFAARGRQDRESKTSENESFFDFEFLQFHPIRFFVFMHESQPRNLTLIKVDMLY